MEYQTSAEEIKVGIIILGMDLSSWVRKIERHGEYVFRKMGKGVCRNRKNRRWTFQSDHFSQNLVTLIIFPILTVITSCDRLTGLIFNTGPTYVAGHACLTGMACLIFNTSPTSLAGLTCLIGSDWPDWPNQPDFQYQPNLPYSLLVPAPDCSDTPR